MRNTEKAFRWIIEILNKHDIPFQISGGLAARVYGSGRELADIDIEIPDDRIQEIVADVKEYIVFSPAVFKNDNWDLLLMTFKYERQEIDICGGESAKIFDQNEKKWTSPDFDLSEAVEKEIFGLTVPVISRQKLINYKTKLARLVDMEDVRNLTGLNGAI